jgi:hypothetical protein
MVVSMLTKEIPGAASVLGEPEPSESADPGAATGRQIRMP